MTVATTHLSFEPAWNGMQLRRLTTWLATMPGPCVPLGDLNMPGPFPRMLSLGRLKTYPTGEPKIQLDHVLAHGGLSGILWRGRSRCRCLTTAAPWSSTCSSPASS